MRILIGVGILCIFSAGAVAKPQATSTRPATTAPSTQASATAARSTAPSTQASATTAPSTQAGAFPTPAELIAKMRSAKKEKESLPHVAMIALDEPIVEKPADFSLFGDADAQTLRSILDRLRQAKHDKLVRAVLLTINADAQVSFAQAEEIRDALAEINRAGKKTFVYADSYDTPAYTIASSATDVCLLDGGDVMIPGVGMETMFAKGLLDKVGVKADFVQIGEYKGADEQYTRTTASEQMKGEMSRLADAMYAQIVDGISLHRNLPKQAVEQLVDQAMISARAAKDRGLVDHLIDQDGLRTLIEGELSAKKIEIVPHYGRKEIDAPDLSNPFSFLASMASQREETSDKPHIGLVYLDGVIVDGESQEGMFGGGGNAGSEDLRKALRAAGRDDNIKAVVIRIDSPGGSALASEVIWQAARRVAEKKPVIISIGSMAASGGYYVASAGETIYADSSAIVGSIGVVGGKFVFSDLAERLGVATESFSRGKNADLFSSTKSWDERQRKMITTWMTDTYDQFLDRILTTRRDRIKHIDDVARGRIFAAKQGKDLGLIDEIGGLHDAIVHAAGKVGLKDGGYDVKALPQPKTLADMFTGRGADAATPIRPKITIDAQAILGALDPASRRLLGQQLQSLQLLQRHPVVLVSPYAIRVR